MFKKVQKYYRIVTLISFFRIKYLLLFTILQDKMVIKYLSSRFQTQVNFTEKHTDHSKNLMIKKTEAVLNRIFPNARCLVRSAVINETLLAYGYPPERIKIGLKIEGNQLFAHAWINKNSKFEKIYEL
uniref:lasso peptide biosynthesis protein n=1 Tax=Candidatus Electrothrix sp. TaxID=2170559 RepID=UPI0040579CC8